MKYKSNFLFSCCFATVLLLGSESALAQDNAAETREGATESSLGASDEIIVTATKRAENIQKVPISMSVLSGEQLSQFQATDVKSIMNLVPNLFVEQIAGQDVIYMRGFGSPPANYSFDQSVSMYVNGVYAGKPRQKKAPFFDVARVEVLRGPQGALYGKNTAAGAISVVSAAPTRDFSAGITGVYNFDERGHDISGFVSGPLSDTLSARIAVRYQNQSGYIRNLYNGKDEPKNKTVLMRGTLKWEPSADFDTTLVVDYENFKRIGGYNSSGSVTEREKPRLTRYGPPNPLGTEGSFNESVLLSNTANVQIGDFTLTSVTGYSWYAGTAVNTYDPLAPDGKTILQNSVFNSYPEKMRQFSQEIRLLSPRGERFEYIVGAYFDAGKFNLDQFGGFDVAGLSYSALLHTFFEQKFRSGSVFGQATVNLTNSLRAIGSLRYSSAYKSAHFGGELVYGPYALRPVNTVARGSFTEGGLDPSATLQLDVAEGVMVYATYGRGSKSGGFVSNTYGTTDATFRYKPERSRNYELGTKFSSSNNMLTGSVSAYNTRFKNLQVSVYNPTLSSFITGNAASATSKGVEASLAFRPSRHFDLSGSGAYQSIKFDDFPGASCLAVQTLQQCDPASPASIAQNNIAGYRPPFTSKFNGSITAHGQIDLSASLRIDITGVATGRSSYNASDNLDPIFGYQKGYVKYDARVQLSPENGRWKIAIIGKNLTNKLTIVNAFKLAQPITSVTRSIKYSEPPRTIALEVGYKF